MGDLSLLAASVLHHNLLAQSNVSKPAAIAAVKLIETPAAVESAAIAPADAEIATYHPEFSPNPVEGPLTTAIPMEASEDASSSTAAPPPAIAQISPQRRSLQPAPTHRAIPMSPPPLSSPELTPTWLEPTPLTTPELSDPVQFSDPTAATHSLSTPRPASGSQLYRQRVVALRAGRTYTRLPANSFWESWVNATQQPTYEQWVSLLAQEAGAMARGQGANRLTVLVGDSLYLWYPPERLASDRFWLNQGISGDTTTGVLRRLSAFAHTRPDTIHVMVGINDLRRGATDTEVLNNSRQIMRQLRRNHPQAQIYIHSILPTRLAAIPSNRIHRLNTNLANIAKQEQVSYLELIGYFADAQGNLRRDLTTDGLHLNPRGYATWQWAMRNG